MTQAEIKEMIKAFAFGFPSSRIAAECGITESEAEEFKRKYLSEIEKKRGEKHE